MQIFLQRSAQQLELCARVVRGEVDVSDQRDLARLLGAYAKQLMLLIKLHQQASREPVERALGDERRSKLLALTQELFDASIRSGRESATVAKAGNLAVPPDAALAPLSSALAREGEALTQSLALSAEALREGEQGTRTDLSEAHAEVERQIETLRDREDLSTVQQQELGRLISAISSQRLLVETQLRAEAWIADWRAAER